MFSHEIGSSELVTAELALVRKSIDLILLLLLRLQSGPTDRKNERTPCHTARLDSGSECGLPEVSLVLVFPPLL